MAHDFVATLGKISYDGYYARSATLTAIAVYAPVHLPEGAIVTSVEWHWYKDDNSATASVAGMTRVLLTNPTESAMSINIPNTIGGDHIVEDTSISDATISSAYSYYVATVLDPNDSLNDIRIRGVDITYTIIRL